MRVLAKLSSLLDAQRSRMYRFLCVLLSLRWFWKEGVCRKEGCVEKSTWLLDVFPAPGTTSTSKSVSGALALVARIIAPPPVLTRALLAAL